MPRWEPDAENRLRRAATALFTERGYDAVTVSDIADCAGLTRRTFFRYFPDKREVLFAGSSRLGEEVERRLDAAAPDEPIQDLLIRVLAQAGAVMVHDRATQQERARIIASSPELQERDRTKTAHLALVFARAMTRRGVAGAELLGAVYADAFRFAYDQALSDEHELGFQAHLTRALRVVHQFVVPRPPS